jgi:basic membrane protein A and related proteins
VKLISRSSAAKALSLAAVSALVLSGCAAAPEAEPTAEPVDFLACAVSDEGNWNDKSFNEAVYTGLLQAEAELGVQINALESATPEDFEPNLQASVDAGCDLIIGVGFALGDAITKISAENPELNFALVDSASESTNVKPLLFETAEAGFLAGYASADYSTSKTIGTYGGLPFPSVTDFMTGYYYGAMQWGMDNDTEVTVLGWDPADPEAAGNQFMNGFAPNNPEGLAIAKLQLESGADVLLPVGGNQFTAAQSAIDEINPDAVMLGVDVDIAAKNPELAMYILTSIEKRMAIATFDVIKGLVDGAAFDATPYIGTLANEGVAISAFTDFSSKVSSGLADKLVELEAGIIDGTYKPKG